MRSRGNTEVFSLPRQYSFIACSSQRSFGSVAGRHWRDATSADAAPRQLDSALVVAHCFYGAVRLLCAMCCSVARFAAQQMRIAIYAPGRCSVAAALRLAGNHIIVTFLDKSGLLSRSVNGVAIQPPQVLTALKNSTAYFWLFSG